MKELRYTLVSEGSSDQVLLPLLTWLLREHRVSMPIQPAWADLNRFPQMSRRVIEKLKASLDFYPCELLFVHRDADREPREVRVQEIQDALAGLSSVHIPPAICVVPVRMQEAWLLFDERALRNAANPNGKQEIRLPPLSKLEQIPDPKSELHELIREASGLHGRRRRDLRVGACVHRLADWVEDFSPLRRLPAFQALETDVAQTVVKQGWDSPWE